MNVAMCIHTIASHGGLGCGRRWGWPPSRLQQRITQSLQRTSESWYVNIRLTMLYYELSLTWKCHLTLPRWISLPAVTLLTICRVYLDQNFVYTKVLRLYEYENVCYDIARDVLKRCEINVCFFRTKRTPTWLWLNLLYCNCIFMSVSLLARTKDQHKNIIEEWC